MAALSGKLTKKLVENLGPGRHGDGAGLYLVVDPSGARRWIVRVTVKGQKNRKGAPLRTDFGLGGADVVTLNQARERALEYRRMAKSGLNPRFNAQREVPTFEELSRQVHIDRLPTWKNAKHGQQWVNTLRDYAFPKIGRMPVDSIDQPEVLMCLAPIWTDKHETARRLAQRIKTVLDVAKSKGFRSGENPVTAIKEARVLPPVKKQVAHHDAMLWREVPAFYAKLATRSAVAAKALQFTILTACRTSEVLEAKWPEIDFEARLWTVPAARMKGGKAHRVPLTNEMLALLEPLRAMASEYVFEGQKRHQPLSNMSMLMLSPQQLCPAAPAPQGKHRVWLKHFTRPSEQGGRLPMGQRQRNKEGQYVPLPYAQLKSAAWRDLSGAAVKLWLELHTRFNGGNNGRLTLSYAEAAETLGMGKATVQRAYDELVDHGFLVLEQEGNWYHRRAHEWRLTTKPMQTPKGRQSPTNDWHHWRPEKTKRGSETEPSALRVVPFENPKRRHGSE